MFKRAVPDSVAANIGAPREGDAHMIGIAISDKIMVAMADRGLTQEGASRCNFMGFIMEEIEEILAIGVAQGRAMERSDGVCRALFDFE